MSTETQSLSFEQVIQAAPAQVYYAFTNATALREWFCDLATVNPRNNGRLYLYWNSGYYTAGEFLQLEAGKKIVFKWHGRNEPAPTQVHVELSAQGDQTLVNLVHTGIVSGPEWSDVIAEYQNGWRRGLENLASAFATGQDLRFVLRPMLGIGVSDFNPVIAAHLGVPVSEGIRLESTLEGMGARAAGLQKDDVIISLAGKEIASYDSLAVALQGQRAGDTVEVIFYRGPQKKIVQMELSRRPIRELPQSVQALGEAVHQRYQSLVSELDQFFAGVSEAEAAHKPAPDEWSVKEVLAHLIHGERDGHNYITSVLGGQEYWSDDYAGNLQARISATVSAYPTLAELLAELKRSYTETAALYASFPEDFPQQHKASFWRLAYGVLETPYHEHDHLAQMKTALDSARQ
jgi:uncharacterized protein YndB with AHSA1/START domain